MFSSVEDFHDGLVLSSTDARGVRNQVSEHRAPKVRASARKNTFWRTSVRSFSVLLTTTRDPYKLEGRNFDRMWDILG